jgi:hypothetical protein
MAGAAGRRSVGAVHAFVASYRLDGVTAAEHDELCEQLAPAMAAVPGLVSMTWLCNAATGRYGGFYVFESKADFDGFVASELFAMLGEQRGLAQFEAGDYAICAVPTAITRGPVPAPVEV